MAKKDLTKVSKNTLSTVQTYEPADLLKCKSLVTQVQENGELAVLTEIRVYVEKCATALDMAMSDTQMKILCDDLLDHYPQESLEDLRECLKKGRRGVYGLGHNRRNALSMVLISEWMGKHLEDKAAAREQEQQERKNQIQEEHKPLTDKVKKMLDAYRKEQEKERVEKSKKAGQSEQEKKDQAVRAWALLANTKTLETEVAKLEETEGNDNVIDLINEELWKRQEIARKAKEEEEKNRKQLEKLQ